MNFGWATRQREAPGCVFVAVALGAFVASLAFLAEFISPYAGNDPWMLVGAAGSLLLGLFLLGFVVRRARARRASQRGACSSCGYDLRGLPSGSLCPECGRKTEAPLLPSRALRRALARRALCRRAFLMLLLMCGALLLLVAGFDVVEHPLSSAGDLLWRLAWICLYTVAGAAALTILAYPLIASFARRHADDIVPHLLSPDLCALCDYDRRGLPPDSPCPECGRTNPAPRA